MKNLQTPGTLRPGIDKMETSRIVQVFEAGMQLEDVIGLYVGEGTEPTPDFIQDAAVKALRDGHTFYTHKRGLPKLRDSIANYTGRLHGVTGDAERVCVTQSGMQAIVLTLQALVDAGDNVVVISPVWPNIFAAIEIAGGEARQVQLDPDGAGGFTLDMNKVEAAIDDRTRAIFVATPGNPTGWLMEQNQQAEMLELARRRNVWIISDEVYHRFVYDREVAPSFLSIAKDDDPLICTHSFSKGWAMTGWRHGWIYHPKGMGELFGILGEFSVSGTQAFLQYGALAAIEEGEAFVKDYVERCRHNGELVYQALASFSRVEVARPVASFYAFFKVDGMGNSLEFAKQLLLDTRVGLAPGNAFGEGGEGYLRLCFASPAEVLSEAIERLRPALS